MKKLIVFTALTLITSSLARAEKKIPFIDHDTCSSLKTLQGECTISIGDDVNLGNAKPAQVTIIKSILNMKGYKIVSYDAKPTYVYYFSKVTGVDVSAPNTSDNYVEASLISNTSPYEEVCEVGVTSPVDGDGSALKNKFLTFIFGNSDLRIATYHLPSCK